VAGGIVDADEKMRTVQRVCAAQGIDPQQAIVMGDGANDLKMMGIAGLSVAFRAKPVVRAQASVALNFSGLDGLLTILS
jgi:phosphoserine phosphatase